MADENKRPLDRSVRRNGLGARVDPRKGSLNGRNVKQKDQNFPCWRLSRLRHVRRCDGRVEAVFCGRVNARRSHTFRTGAQVLSISSSSVECVMSRAAVRSLQGSMAIALLLSAGSPSAVVGQGSPDIGGIVGAILNSALMEQARREWERRPIADYSCLEAHNLAADRLAAEGIGPSDPGFKESLHFARERQQARPRPSSLRS